MLNEIKEYEEYTGKIEECNRLIPLFFYKGRNGIPRALRIVARHLLFDEYSYYTVKKQEDRIIIREKVANILAAWCGFEYNTTLFDNDKIDISSLNKWLPRYLTYKDGENKDLSSEIRNEHEKEISIFLSERQKNWNVEEKGIYNYLKYEIFSINAVNFYVIIADAIAAGPLKEYVFICKNNFLDETKELKAYDQDRLIKILSAYLLTNAINKVDLANWMNHESFGTGKQIDEGIFGKFLCIDGTNVSINPDFIKLCEIHIEERSKCPQTGQANQLVFKDLGSGKCSLSYGDDTGFVKWIRPDLNSTYVCVQVIPTIIDFKMAYIAVGVNCDGQKQSLGAWIQSVGSKLFNEDVIFQDLKENGLKDVLINDQSEVLHLSNTIQNFVKKDATLAKEVSKKIFTQFNNTEDFLELVKNYKGSTQGWNKPTSTMKKAGELAISEQLKKEFGNRFN